MIATVRQNVVRNVAEMHPKFVGTIWKTVFTQVSADSCLGIIYGNE